MDDIASFVWCSISYQKKFVLLGMAKRGKYKSLTLEIKVKILRKVGDAQSKSYIAKNMALKRIQF